MRRFDADRLVAWTRALFEAAGMEGDKAASVAEILVEADMMGHDTHGLALAPRYLERIASGRMTTAGSYTVVADRGATVLWHGHRLPGIWLTQQALALAADRAPDHGVVTVVIGDSEHNGALGAFLRPIAERGLIATINCATPSLATTAPHGGTTAVLTPNPVAFGFPTAADPVIVDISSTITTNNRSMAMARRGEVYDHDWLLTADGQPTNDPATVRDGGTLMLLGGWESGHKGFGLALMVEALSQGLSGIGRAAGPDGLSLSVFVQVIDPGAFGGRDTFVTEAQHLAEACRASPPRPGTEAVRMPGDRAAALRRQALAGGVPLADTTVAALTEAAGGFGLSPPA